MEEAVKPRKRLTKQDAKEHSIFGVKVAAWYAIIQLGLEVAKLILKH